MDDGEPQETEFQTRPVHLSEPCEWMFAWLIFEKRPLMYRCMKTRGMVLSSKRTRSKQMSMREMRWNS